MAILSPFISISVRGSYFGQRWENKFWYEASGAAFLTATPATVGEAYWNHVKTAWRALTANSNHFSFGSVFVAEPGSTGAYGEYPIPIGEQQGTRGTAAGNDEFMLPPFMCVGMRLSVATRMTKPGQKRFAGMTEGDMVSGSWSSGLLALAATLGGVLSNVMALGAPVALGSLAPIVVRSASLEGLVIEQQPVTGYLLNSRPTTQNSRKVGRGS